MRRRGSPLDSGWLGSMRVRIIVVVVALLLLSSAGSVVLLRTVLLERLDREVADQLAREAEEFQLLSRGNDPRTGEPFDGDLEAIFDVYFSREIPDEGESLLAFVDGMLYASARAQDAAASEELRSPILFWQSLESSQSGVIDTSLGEAHYVALPMNGSGSDGLFVVANFPAFEREEIDGAIRTQIAVYLVTLLLASLLAFALAGRVLRPLLDLAATARTISETDLSGRIPVRGRDEASKIAETFNDMLSRLETVVTTQRRFLDDTSHELRTPLTVIRGHLELMALDETPADRDRTIMLVLDEVDRLSRMVNDLFLLARADHPDFLETEPVELGDLVRQVHFKMGALSSHRWAVDTAPGIWVSADPQRLTQALMQLAANAARHTPDGSEITLSAVRRDGRAVLAVSDSGPGVASVDADRVFQRAARGDGTGGAGLGMAIVMAIAKAHGGTARLADTDGRGARFEIVLPMPARSAS